MCFESWRVPSFLPIKGLDAIHSLEVSPSHRSTFFEHGNSTKAGDWKRWKPPKPPKARRAPKKQQYSLSAFLHASGTQEKVASCH